jgi:hypothetical protein
MNGYVTQIAPPVEFNVTQSDFLSETKNQKKKIFTLPLI